VFALFLWFGKKYHPVANLFFLIIALGIYFVPIPPITWGFFRALKEYRLDDFNFVFPILFLPSLLIFISFSVRNVAGNIFAYFKTSQISRTVYFLVTLFVVPAALLAYPLLDSFKLLDRTMNVNTAVGGDLPLVYTTQSLTSLDRYNKAGDFTSKFDPSVQKYLYHLRLSEPLIKSIQFTGVEIDGVKINFITDSWVECLNCQKSADDPHGLVFPVGRNIDFIVTSNQMIKVIKFIESGDKAAEFVFWE
jgi:heme/copper-type cytochrome/quinol oxidase subunit 2